MADLFSSMTELVRNESEFMFETENRLSDKLITAIHGGGIEVGTSELAKCIAEQTKANYFSFKGLKSKNNYDFHVTSTNYDYPDLLMWNQNMNHTIAIHGYASKKAHTYIGGLDKQLVSLITQNLKNAGFSVDIAPNHLAGREPHNITNKNKRGMGVQLELSTQQRKELFINNDSSRANREVKRNWSENMYKYANAINNALQYIQ